MNLDAVSSRWPSERWLAARRKVRATTRQGTSSAFSFGSSASGGAGTQQNPAASGLLVSPARTGAELGGADPSEPGQRADAPDQSDDAARISFPEAVGGERKQGRGNHAPPDQLHRAEIADSP